MKSNSMVKAVLVSLTTTVLFSCGGNVYKSNKALDESFASLKSSTSKQQWIESDRNFDAIFSELESQNVESASFCQALKERSNEELALISGELEHTALANDCADEIDARVNEYFKPFEEKAEIKPMKINQKTVVTSVADYRKLDGKESFIKDKEVILTYDDGPVVKNTAPLVELLKKWNVKSMFFVVGSQAAKPAGTQYAKYIKSLGHTMATHSRNHVGMKGTYKTKGIEGLKYEIIENHEMVDKLLGGISPFFRFPGGTANPEIDAIVNNWGLSIWHWSIDSFDYNTPNPDAIVKRVISELEKKRKGMLLFHDIHAQTHLAMPEILKYLAENNYTVLLPVEK